MYVGAAGVVSVPLYLSCASYPATDLAGKCQPSSTLGRDD